MLDNKPRLKKVLHHLMMNELTARPRWWTRTFMNPFFIEKGKGSVIKRGARLDIIPSKKFSIGKNTVVETRVTINNQVGDVTIGDHSMLTVNVTVVGPVSIGDNVIVGNGTLIFGMWHNYDHPDIPIDGQGVSTNRTVLENDVWIGGNSVINQGVTIGSHSLVGSGSVVTKNVPPYTLVAGSPARIIKQYDKQTKTWVRVSASK